MSDEFLGLEDGGKEVVSCLSCGENLCVLWDVDPNASEKMFIIAKCPFCDGKSKKYTVKKKNRLGIPDSGKISHIDFSDEDGGNTQILLPFVNVSKVNSDTEEQDNSVDDEADCLDEWKECEDDDGYETE